MKKRDSFKIRQETENQTSPPSSRWTNSRFSAVVRRLELLLLLLFLGMRGETSGFGSCEKKLIFWRRSSDDANPKNSELEHAFTRFLERGA
jgi:hypothetical protein